MRKMRFMSVMYCQTLVSPGMGAVLQTCGGGRGAGGRHAAPAPARGRLGGQPRTGLAISRASPAPLTHPPARPNSSCKHALTNGLGPPPSPAPQEHRVARRPACTRPQKAAPPRTFLARRVLMTEDLPTLG